MLGEVVDTSREESDLDAGGAGVSLAHPEPLDDLALFGRAETHLRLVVDVQDVRILRGYRYSRVK
jgi:hypothetical protein